MEFQGVYLFNATELDIYFECMNDEDRYVSSIAEIGDSKLLRCAKKARDKNFKSYFVQTYDDVFEIVCEKYTLEIQK